MIYFFVSFHLPAIESHSGPPSSQAGEADGRVGPQYHLPACSGTLTESYGTGGDGIENINRLRRKMTIFFSSICLSHSTSHIFSGSSLAPCITARISI
jgi:hypothetical protein